MPSTCCHLANDNANDNANANANANASVNVNANANEHGVNPTSAAAEVAVPGGVVEQPESAAAPDLSPPRERLGTEDLKVRAIDSKIAPAVCLSVCLSVCAVGAVGFAVYVVGS